MKTPYKVHSGTVKVSGTTDCVRAANCMAHYITQHKTPVEVLVIGANACRQAIKAIGLLKSTVEDATGRESTILVDHLHVEVPVERDQGVVDMEATVFRCLVVRKADFDKILIQNTGSASCTRT